MPSANIVVETQISTHPRVQQLSAIFDMPIQEKSRLAWNVDLPIEVEPWNVGLIVGPSGSGKSTIAKNLWPKEYAKRFKWGKPSVIEDFDESFSLNEISKICQAVGFNTIPAWVRPFKVLSNGEQFRVELARRLLETKGVIVVDEFTSVVDRQVAKIGSHAVQKYARRNDKQFIGVSCHHDIIDWLQPDWVFDVPSRTLERRSLRPRPKLEVEIRRVHHSIWKLFAPFHYLTAQLNTSARCFCLFVRGAPVAFTGVIHFAHPKVKNIKRISRTVTLPDWQGLGLSFVLNDFLASCYKTQGFRVRNYPAHPAYIRAHDKSKVWALTRRPGIMASGDGRTSTIPGVACKSRPCAVFEYVGKPENQDVAEKLLV